MATTPIPLFRFWCQKVLPLVFDDSLSYYEVLAKAVDYLNHIITDLNTATLDIDEVRNQLTALREYVDERFSNLNLDEATRNALDEMVNNGTLETIIVPAVAQYANPVFVDSVDDMRQSNLAYVNRENNMVYIWDDTNAEYVNTGHAFGGVVQTTSDMTDEREYYALATDGFIYAYNYPNLSWSSLDVLFGGYRSNVSSMLPIGRIYVLTTDNHIYQWNGNQYTDTGVIYSGTNDFDYRFKLNSQNNLDDLTLSGWYDFDHSSVPQGVPNNMETTDGIFVKFSDSRLLLNKAGGMWYKGNEWKPISVSGFSPCDDCFAVNNTGVFFCNSTTLNKPDDNNGVLISFVTDERLLLYRGDKLWYSVDDEWKSLVDNETQYETDAKIDSLNARMDALLFEFYQSKRILLSAMDSLQTNLNELWNVTTQTQYAFLLTEDNLSIERLTVPKKYPITAKDLNSPFIPADSAIVGETIANVFTVLSEQLLNVQAIARSSAEQSKEALDEIEGFRQIIVPGNSYVVSQNGAFLLTSDNKAISGAGIAIETDDTLSSKDLPANSAATGNAISALDNRLASLETKRPISNEFGYPFRIDFARIVTQNGAIITCEHGVVTMPTVGVVTDETLSVSGMPADSYSTGSAIRTNTEAITNEITSRNTLEHRVANIATATAQITSGIYQRNVVNITTSYYQCVLTQDGKRINGDYYAATVSAATKNYVDNQISNLEADKFDINSERTLHSPGITFVTPLLELTGNLPTTKSRVTMAYVLKNGTTSYTGSCSIKTQGASSTFYPEKNFTITFDKDIVFCCIKTNEWILKANYNDSSYARNLVGAMQWLRCVDSILGDAVQYALVAGDNAIVTENYESITVDHYNHRIQRSPANGVSYGDFIYLTNNGDFHGIYTMQLPKDAFMFGMGSSDTFIVSMESWSMLNTLTASNYSDYVEIEYQGDNVTDEQVLDALNAFPRALHSADVGSSLAAFTNLDLICAYMYHCAFLGNYDGVVRNALLYSYDGGAHINFSVWDMDCILGFNPSATSVTGVGRADTSVAGLSQLKHYPYNAKTALTKLKQNKTFEWILNNDYNRFASVVASLKDSVNPDTVMYDYMCLYSHISKDVIDQDFAKWPMKPRSAMCGMELPVQWGYANLTAVLKEMEDYNGNG